MTAQRPACPLRRRRGDHGGAVSLWVVLMCPVAAFAAVVATAGPQRLTAETTLQDAADDLAVFAVAWRDGTGAPSELPVFPPDCDLLTPQERQEVSTLFDDLPAGDAAPDAQLQLRIHNLFEAVNGRVGPAVAETEPQTQNQLRSWSDRLDEWEGVCGLLADSLTRDLGQQGIDIGSLTGFYSTSLRTARLGTSADTHPGPPCQITRLGVSGTMLVVRDAVHVALVADWQAGGWAVSQVWPDGVTMAAESVGRYSEFDDAGLPDECGDGRFDIHDSQGRPVWPSVNAWSGTSRELVQLVQRFPLSG